MQLGQITQTLDSAEVLAGIDWLLPYFTGRATSNPDTDVFSYWNGILLIGQVWGEPADFISLVDFQASADEEMATMWHDLKQEMGWWLEDQSLQRWLDDPANKAA